jgi:excisionase family DNA binding protein
MLLTVRQAAERLGVSVALVYALCSRRRIRHERHGLGRGVIRIPEAGLEEYRRGCVVGEDEGAASRPPPARVKLKHLQL